MKEQDALILVSHALKRLTAGGEWAQITIEINHGKIKFVNVTEPLREGLPGEGTPERPSTGGR